MRLRSRRVLLDGLLRPASLRIEDGAIAAIDPWDAGGDDQGDLVVMAGLVDTHVHLNEPGRTEWEGFASATRAAAAGGVTTLVDMPLNCVPVTVDAEALEVKLAAARGQLRVDCGFWGGVVPGNVGALGPLCRCGALGAKAFLCDSGIPEFPASDGARLRSAMRELKDAGRPLLAHAELVDEASTHGDPRAYSTYLRSRPARWEVRAIELLVQLCRETGCAVHVVHLSAADALPVIAAAKEEGLPLTVETCPHYLGLAAESIPDGATEYKCAPPIRGEANAEALWAALGEGTIDLVVSDHSPCVPALKLPERGDFLEAWGGIAGLQLGLSSVWTGASARGYRVDHVARWMSERPAAFAGLRGKGRIASGYRADLVAWDPDARWTVQAGDLLHRHPVSPWVGRTLRGRVRRTWLGGAPIWDDGPVGDAAGRALRAGVDA